MDSSTAADAGSSTDSGTGTGTGTDGNSSSVTGTGTGTSSNSSSSASYSFTSTPTNTTNTTTKATCNQPWPCPNPYTDGGVLGPRNYGNSDVGYAPCDGNITYTSRPQILCNQSILAISGLNLTTTYSGTEAKTGKAFSYTVPKRVTKGDPYPIMLVISNALYSTKMLFQPKVDEFTQLEIGASHGVKYFSVPNTFISVEAGGVTTGPRTRIFRVPAINTASLGYAENNLGIEDIKYNYMDFDVVKRVSTTNCTQDVNHFPSPNNCPTEYKNSAMRYAVVPFWTVLINADTGFINDIHFDEGCDACSDQLCSPDNNCGVQEFACTVQSGNSKTADHNPTYSIASMSKCALDRVSWFDNSPSSTTGTDPLTQCYDNTTLPDGLKLSTLQTTDTVSGYDKNTTDCSIKVFVGWTGTDVNGKYFTSAGKRLSVFRRYSIGAAYNSASTFADNALPTAPDTTGTNLPG